jgi:hypothetical protein
VEICGAVLAASVVYHVYLTAKKLAIKEHGNFFAAVAEIEKLETEVDKLTWPENRPVLIFDHWGEVPHDDPRASFHEVDKFYHDRRYWERGIFILTAAAMPTKSRSFRSS